ncbi:hypothetical protein GCM10007881_43910 [Mesorhizobium huakuii]|uniref:Uncharacterized protein n=1 Tax=Mesorhizobium qingshengii TaxID=1165689 RepID=A0A1G5ZUD7_9HYPH|nr:MULTISPECIES: hypothetical protein [Mesorhizobium]AID34368.1 hypothetical protein MCHK_7024 [Mesorhizobium huakuii 7653R]MCH4560535.1 hypothetical protein [Mesorhizobium jarvisii]GLQ80871.1 hypothetical protein GCM10007881_43910 [Mesorhizobium huakuii]SDA98411.1 hypothetical protein SAMN02927914_06197 [Mesorhizobium qingshengii]
MSRYTITVTGTVTGKVRSDPDAVIGYDPPLRTYFLQAFPHEETDEPALWLGTRDRAFETLEDLRHAAISHGYHLMPLSPELAARLVDDKAAASGRPDQDGILGDLLKHLNQTN